MVPSTKYAKTRNGSSLQQRSRRWPATQVVLLVAALMFSVVFPEHRPLAMAAQLGCPFNCCYQNVCNCGYSNCNCGWDWNNGCYYCCDSCPTCQCFTDTAYGSDYWSGCSGRSMTVAGGAFGRIVDGSQALLTYVGGGATGQVDPSASVSTVRAGAGSTTTHVYGSVSGYDGGGNGGGVVYVYNGGSIGTVSNMASGTISVASGGNIGNAYLTSGNVLVSGSITNIYPTASNVYVYSTASTSLIQGYGPVISIAGSVGTVRVTASSTVTVAGIVTTVSLAGGSSPLSVTGTTTDVVVGTSGNTITFTGGLFSTMTFTVPQTSGTTLSMSGGTAGCIVFQSTVANVPMVFTSATFTRSCHFIDFRNTVTSSSVIANGGTFTIPGGYSALYGYSTFADFLLRWNAARLTTAGGTSHGFFMNAVGASGATISVANCNGATAMQTAGDVLRVLNGNSGSGSFISFLITSSTMSCSGSTLQCGSATVVTVSVTSSTVTAATINAYFTGSVSSLLMYAQSSTLTASGTANLYVATSMASSTVTCYISTFNAPSGYGVYVGTSMTSSSILVSSSASWVSGYRGISVDSLNAVSLIITQSSSWVTTQDGFVVRAGPATSLGITVMTSSYWNHNTATGLSVAGAANTVNVLVQANSGIYSSAQNFYIAGSATSVSITITSTGSGDPARITSTVNSNVYCTSGVTNVGIYVLGAGALLQTPARNLYVTNGASSNVDMSVLNGASVTANIRNWEFNSASPMTGTSNQISILGQSTVYAQIDNFLFQSTGSLGLTVAGTSTLTANTGINLRIDGDSGMLRVVFTSSTITAAINNILLGGSILNDQTPNYVYMTTATMSAGSTGMIFSTTLGGQNIFTITASTSTTWSVGGVGAILQRGSSISGTISIISSTISVSTTNGNAAVVQLQSGTALTMNTQRIYMEMMLYTYTQTTGAVAPTYGSIIRSMDTNMVSSTITVLNCNFNVVAPLTHRMEILDLQGVTKLTSTTILLSKIPYTSNSLSCSTLPKGYPACDALMRGAILQQESSGSVSSCSITVQCIEFSTTTLSFMDFYGAVSNTFFRSDSVAIWQSQAIVSFLALNQPTGSINNVVWILFTYLHVPIIVHSANGNTSINSIASNCSFMSVYPMAEGFFEPELVPLVVRPQLWTCSKTYHPSCWITKSFSLSLTVTMTLSSTISLSNEHTQTTTGEVTMTETDETTGTVSMSGEVTKTTSVTQTASRLPTPSWSTVPTRTKTLALTMTVARGGAYHPSGSGSYTPPSPTLSGSSSVSASDQPSTTQSRTLSSSATSTQSPTTTLSTTPTLNHSTSDSETIADSQSWTDSMSVSTSMSGSWTTSETMSLTVSAPPPTLTDTHSATSSVSVGTWTSDASETRSQSATFSKSSSRSQTPSFSATPDPTSTPTTTVSAEPSSTKSVSMTTSQSFTEELSKTLQSPTETLSMTPSLSEAATMTQRTSTRTASPEPTDSGLTPSESGQLSGSPSVSTFPSASKTGSNSTPPPTDTPTVTETMTLSSTETVTVGTVTDARSQSESTTTSRSVTPTTSESAPTSTPEWSTTTTVSISPDGDTLETTLSETQTWSATSSWSIVRMSATVKRSRSPTKATSSHEVTATPTLSSSVHSLSREATSDWSTSFTQSPSRSASQRTFSSPMSLSKSNSVSFSGERRSATWSNEVSHTMTRTVHRQSRTLIPSESATTSETLTLTTTASISHLRKSHSLLLTTTNSVSFPPWTSSISTSMSLSKKLSRTEPLDSTTRTMTLTEAGSATRSRPSESVTASLLVVKVAPPPPVGGGDGGHNQTATLHGASTTTTQTVNIVSMTVERGVTATRQRSGTMQHMTRTSTNTLSIGTSAHGGRRATWSAALSGEWSSTRPTQSEQWTATMTVSPIAGSQTSTDRLTRSWRRSEMKSRSFSVTMTRAQHRHHHLSVSQEATLTVRLTLSDSSTQRSPSKTFTGPFASSTVTSELRSTHSTSEAYTTTSTLNVSATTTISQTTTNSKSMKTRSATAPRRPFVWRPPINATTRSAQDRWDMMGGLSMTLTESFSTSRKSQTRLAASDSARLVSVTVSTTVSAASLTLSPTTTFVNASDRSVTAFVVTATHTNQRKGGGAVGGWGWTATVSATATRSTTEVLSETAWTLTSTATASISDHADSWSPTMTLGTHTLDVTGSRHTEGFASSPTITLTALSSLTSSLANVSLTMRHDGEPARVGNNAALNVQRLFAFEGPSSLSSGITVVVAVNVALLAAYAVGRVLAWVGVFAHDAESVSSRSGLLQFSVRHAYLSVLVACASPCGVVYGAAGALQANAVLLLAAVISMLFMSSALSGLEVPSTSIVISTSSLIGAAAAIACGLVVRLAVYLVCVRRCLPSTLALAGSDRTGELPSHSSATFATTSTSQKEKGKQSAKLPPSSSTGSASVLPLPAAAVVNSRPSTGGVRSLRDLFATDGTPRRLHDSSSSPSHRRLTQADQVDTNLDDIEEVIDLDAMSMRPMAPLHVNEMELSHGSRTSSQQSISHHPPRRHDDGLPAQTMDAMLEDIEIPSDLFDDEIDVESLDPSVSSEDRRMEVSHIGQGTTRGLRGGGGGRTAKGSAPSSYAAAAPAGSAVDATTGRMMWVPQTHQKDDTIEDISDNGDDADRAMMDFDDDGEGEGDSAWFASPTKGNKKAWTHEEEVSIGWDPTEYHFDDSNRPVDVDEAQAPAALSQTGGDDFIASLFEDSAETTNDDLTVAHAQHRLPPHQRAGPYVVSNMKALSSSGSLEKRIDSTSSSRDGEEEEEDRWLTLERGIALLLLIIAAVLLVVLLVGASSYPPEVSGGMALSVVLDVVIGQSLFAGGAMIVSLRC